jgi:hypothetical protein
VLLEDRGDIQQRLRAACVLAGYQPEDGRWAQVAPALAEQLVKVNPLLLKDWSQALYPVRGVPRPLPAGQPQRPVRLSAARTSSD